MRTILWAAGGVLALGLLAGTAPAASAAPLGGAAAAMSGATQQAAPENVYWVRRCWRERRWWGGRWHWVTRCGSAWVRPRPYW